MTAVQLRNLLRKAAAAVGKTMTYSYERAVAKNFLDAVTLTRQALSDHGFGIITEIDVKATLKKKLNVDFDDYLILGACHPGSAFKILQVELKLGLFMPCNVNVYRKNGSTYVAAMMPSIATKFTTNKNVAEIAADVEERLVAVVNQATL